MYIDVFPLGSVENDVANPYFSVGRSFGSWGLTLKVEPYVAVGGEVEGGWIIHLKGNIALDLAGRSFSVAPSFSRDDGAFGFDPTWLAGLVVGTDFSVGTTMTITPKVKVSVPLSSVDDGRGTEVVSGLNFSF